MGICKSIPSNKTQSKNFSSNNSNNNYDKLKNNLTSKLVVLPYIKHNKNKFELELNMLKKQINEKVLLKSNFYLNVLLKEFLKIKIDYEYLYSFNHVNYSNKNNHIHDKHSKRYESTICLKRYIKWLKMVFTDINVNDKYLREELENSLRIKLFEIIEDYHNKMLYIQDIFYHIYKIINDNDNQNKNKKEEYLTTSLSSINTSDNPIFSILFKNNSIKLYPIVYNNIYLNNQDNAKLLYYNSNNFSAISYTDKNKRIKNGNCDFIIENFLYNKFIKGSTISINNNNKNFFNFSIQNCNVSDFSLITNNNINSDISIQNAIYNNKLISNNKFIYKINKSNTILDPSLLFRKIILYYMYKFVENNKKIFYNRILKGPPNSFRWISYLVLANIKCLFLKDSDIPSDNYIEEINNKANSGNVNLKFSHNIKNLESNNFDKYKAAYNNINYDYIIELKIVDNININTHIKSKDFEDNLETRIARLLNNSSTNSSCVIKIPNKSIRFENFKYNSDNSENNTNINNTNVVSINNNINNSIYYKLNIFSSNILYNYLLSIDIPDELAAQIRKDVHRTLPETNYFSIHINQEKLYRILKCLSMLDNELEYCQGMNLLSGVVLYASDFNELETFYFLTSIFSKTYNNDKSINLRLLYLNGFYHLRLLYEYFNYYLEKLLPDLDNHFKKLSITNELYLPKWFLSFFTCCFELNNILRIMDCVLVLGTKFYVSLSLCLLKQIKKQLLKLNENDEIIEYFRQLNPFYKIPKDEIHYYPTYNFELIIKESIDFEFDYNIVEKIDIRFKEENALINNTNNDKCEEGFPKEYKIIKEWGLLNLDDSFDIKTICSCFGSIKKCDCIKINAIYNNINYTNINNNEKFNKKNSLRSIFSYNSICSSKYYKSKSSIKNILNSNKNNSSNYNVFNDQTFTNNFEHVSFNNNNNDINSNKFKNKLILDSYKNYSFSFNINNLNIPIKKLLYSFYIQNNYSYYDANNNSRFYRNASYEFKYNNLKINKYYYSINKDNIINKLNCNNINYLLNTSNVHKLILNRKINDIYSLNKGYKKIQCLSFKSKNNFFKLGTSDKCVNKFAISKDLSDSNSINSSRSTIKLSTSFFMNKKFNKNSSIFDNENNSKSIVFNNSFDDLYIEKYDKHLENISSNNLNKNKIVFLNSIKKKITSIKTNSNMNLIDFNNVNSPEIKENYFIPE